MTSVKRLTCRAFAVALSGALVLGGLASSAFAAGDGIPRPPGAIDGRGYEMVSQADKNQDPVNATSAMAPDGEHVIWSALGGVTGSTSGAVSWLFATRTSAGWTSKNILPPGPGQLDDSYQMGVTTDDLSTHVWSVAQALSQSGVSPGVSMVRLDNNGNQTLLHSFPTLFGNTGTPYVASDDMAHVFTNSPEPVRPSHQPGTNNVYDFGSGTPELVSVMPGTGLAPLCGVPQGGPSFANDAQVSSPRQHWVSTNGMRVFFISTGDTCDNLKLYMRDRVAETTTLISSPVVAGDETDVNRFLGATADGSQAFYRTDARLDVDDTDTTQDIYRYTVGVGNKCLTCVATNDADVSANPNNGAGVSEDGSHVYFVTFALINGQGTDGVNNLWVWRNDTLHFISPANGVNAFPNFNGQITPDGNVLLFLSNQPDLDTLTGSSNGGFRQMYRYDDRDGSVTCVSCPPGGAPATSDLPAASGALVRAGLSLGDERDAMSEDGSIVAFSTLDALVAEDVNHSFDIYEWHNGAVGLITNGKNVSGLTPNAPHPELVDVSANGRDILFQDAARLTHDAIDDWAKVYDARVGGGFPPAPTPPAPCDRDQCHGDPTNGPVLADPGSATARSKGNVKSTPPPGFRLGKVTAAQRVKLAKSGRLTLKVRVSARGRVSAFAQAQIGKHVRVVASKTRTARAPGTVRVTLRLSRAAREQLAKAGDLKVVIAVRFTGALSVRRLVLPLKRSNGAHASATADAR